MRLKVVSDMKPHISEPEVNRLLCSPDKERLGEPISMSLLRPYLPRPETSLRLTQE